MKPTLQKTILTATLSAIVGLSNVANAQWVQVNNALTDQEVNALMVSGNNLFAGTGTISSNSSGNNGVFLTTDNGDNWVEKNSGLISINPPFNLGVSCFAVSGNNIFAGTDGENSGGLFLSADNGNTWTAANSGIPNGTDVYSLAIAGSTIFAGCDDDKVYISNNNGSTWAAGSSVTGSGGKIRALAVSGTNIFAGAGNRGVFLSTDNGQTWTAVNTGLGASIPYENIYALAVSGTNIFAGAYGGGVFISANNGAQWNAVNNGLTSKLVKAFAISGNVIFAGTEYYGTFVSTDNGSNWAGTGSAGQSVVALAYNSTYLFAGTKGDGVFRRPLSEIAAGINNTINNSNFSIYPNPSNNHLFIEISNFKNTTAEIYNITGQLMEKIILQNERTTINTEKFSSGIYFLKIKNAENVSVKKFAKE